jgi:hypothetical protein
MGPYINTRIKKVGQCDADGNLIRSWSSIKSAAQILGISGTGICAVCGGKTRQKTAGGFVWKYL